MILTLKDLYERVYSVINGVDFKDFLFEVERLSKRINSLIRENETELEILSCSSSSVVWSSDLESIIVKNNLTSTTLSPLNTIAQIISAMSGADSNSLVYYKFKTCVVDFTRLWIMKDGVQSFYDRQPFNELMMNMQADKSGWSNSSGFVSFNRTKPFMNLGGLTHTGDFYFSNNNLVLTYDALMGYSSAHDLPSYKLIGIAKKGIETIPHTTNATTLTSFYVPDYCDSLLENGVIYTLLMRPKYRDFGDFASYKEQYDLLLGSAVRESVNTISYNDRRKGSVWK